MITNDLKTLQNGVGCAKWWVATGIALLAAGGGIVALLEHFDKSEPLSLPTPNSVIVVFVATADPQILSQPAPADQPLTIVHDTPIPPQPSPTDFIVSYWQNVSVGRFEISWAQLSPGFRHAMHHDDFSDYVRGLQEMQICQILASNPLVAARDDYSATVAVHLAFQTGAHCISNEYNFESRLIYDGVSNTWFLDKNMIK